MAELFIGPREKGKQVNHKDGDKRNNLLSNLEYVTPKENTQHAIKMGIFKNPNQEQHKKLNRGQITVIVELLKHRRVCDIARELGLNRSTLENIKRGRNYRQWTQCHSP